MGTYSLQSILDELIQGWRKAEFLAYELFGTGECIALKVAWKDNAWFPYLSTFRTNLKCVTNQEKFVSTAFVECRKNSGFWLVFFLPFLFSFASAVRYDELAWTHELFSPCSNNT